jgi:hypothetical protein
MEKIEDPKNLNAAYRHIQPFMAETARIMAVFVMSNFLTKAHIPACREPCRHAQPWPKQQEPE